MESYVVAACVGLSGLAWAYLRWRRFVQNAAWVAAAPFIISWKIAVALWEGYGWASNRYKLWKRRPAYGDSSWASKKELKQAGNLAHGGFVAGWMGRRKVRTHREHSLLMFGRPGSGKSLTMGASLDDAEDDTFITYDPPGALLKRFRAPLEAKGYRVLHIDLDKPLKGWVYDVCAALDGVSSYTRDTYVRDLSNLATSDLHDGGKNSEHFADTARILVQGILEWLFENERNNANFFGVAKILLSSSTATRGAIFKQIAKSGSEVALRAVNMWEAAESAKGGEASGFRSSVTRALDSWMTQAYRDLTTLDGRDVFSWKDVFESPQPVAVFLTGGVLRGKQVKAFVRVFFGQAASVLATRFSEGIETRWTKLMIDEGVVLGRCEPILSAVEEMRKVKVSVLIGYQSMMQMKGIWGTENAGVLADCCDWAVSGGGKDSEGYLKVSQLIGTETRKSMSKNASGTSESEVGRHLQGIEDTFRLERGQVLLLLDNKAALLAKPFRIRKNEVIY